MSKPRRFFIYMGAYAAVYLFAGLVPPQPLPMWLRFLIGSGIVLVLDVHFDRCRCTEEHPET